MDRAIASNSSQWDAELYDNKHEFVSQLATDLVKLLSPQPGERILDLGCGTGHLTFKIASSKAKVLGIDSAATMIEKARRNYPTIDFAVVDGANLEYTEQFDSVFSNAVLHWIKPPEAVILGVWNALKPGGKFVAEFGGKGNINLILTALDNAIKSLDLSGNEELRINYFPSIAEYGTLLEKQGFQFTYANLFNRLTPLADAEVGMSNWLRMFRGNLLGLFPEETQTKIIAKVEEELRPLLYKNGQWFADYRRIRIVAIKDLCV